MTMIIKKIAIMCLTLNLRSLTNYAVSVSLCLEMIKQVSLLQFIYDLLKEHFACMHCTPALVLQDSSSRATSREGSTSFTPWALRFLITALAQSSAAWWKRKESYKHKLHD